MDVATPLYEWFYGGVDHVSTMGSLPPFERLTLTSSRSAHCINASQWSAVVKSVKTSHCHHTCRTSIEFDRRRGETVAITY